MSASEIIPHIWIAGSKIAASKTFLLEKKIQILVNCSDNDPFPNTNLQKIRIPTPSFQENLTDILLPRLQEMLNAYLNLQPILVYCRDGNQYSATILTIFLMRYTKCDYRLAIQLLKSKRPTVYKHRVEHLSLIEKLHKYFPSGQFDTI
jgi:hypothetical protein